MKWHAKYSFIVFVLSICVITNNFALNCETTLATNEISKGGSSVYVASCRIDTQEASPLEIPPGKEGILTAEQQIRLGPGFHAYVGSRLQTHFRDCVRNPDEKTGFASWGNYVWRMEPTAAKLVDHFHERDGWNVRLMHNAELADYELGIPDYFRDVSQVTEGKDDEPLQVVEVEQMILAQGIDKGVFLFHIGHGRPEGFQVRDGNESTTTDVYGIVVSEGDGTTTEIDPPQEMRLGNCKSDGTASGELRYLWLLSCRAFAHGPSDAVVSDEYSRPSDFDFMADPPHQNVIERWGDVLTENMRMACGSSTRASSGSPNHMGVVNDIKTNYFYKQMNVADSWGHALAWSLSQSKPRTRNAHQTLVTPLCLAKGNKVYGQPSEIRSPITDDFRFTNAANPFNGAWHVVSWEWDPAAVTPGLPDLEKKQQLLTGLPVFLVQSALPVWSTENLGMSMAEGYIKVGMPKSNFHSQGKMLLSKETTGDGRPLIKVDTTTGSVVISGDIKPLSNHPKAEVLSREDYVGFARSFIEEQGWSEADMDAMQVVRGIVQVVPLKSQRSQQEILKTQKDVTVYIGRRIPVKSMSVRALGSDNVIVVHMNNDGSIKTALKSWRTISGKVEGIPLKSYEQAYTEAVAQLKNSGLYELSEWDWGYKSAVDDNGRAVMIINYIFVFEPIAAVKDCISQQVIIEIQGHVL